MQFDFKTLPVLAGTLTLLGCGKDTPKSDGAAAPLAQASLSFDRSSELLRSRHPDSVFVVSDSNLTMRSILTEADAYLASGGGVDSTAADLYNLVAPGAGAPNDSSGIQYTGHTTLEPILAGINGIEGAIIHLGLKIAPEEVEYIRTPNGSERIVIHDTYGDDILSTAVPLLDLAKDMVIGPRVEFIHSLLDSSGEAFFIVGHTRVTIKFSNLDNSLESSEYAISINSPTEAPIEVHLRADGTSFDTDPAALSLLDDLLYEKIYQDARDGTPKITKI